MMPLAPRGMAYLPYQAEGVRWAGGRSSGLIADEMGLGKTIQAIGIVNQMPHVESVLVVCPASIKVNWQREIDRWLISPFIQVNIINYDVLHKLDRLDWDVVILDEAHYIKNAAAARSKFCRRLIAPTKILLTGTPVLNRPKELWHMLHILDPQTWPLNSYHAFGIRYCAGHRQRVTKHKTIWNFDGASNLHELRERLAPYMIRRLKADVLKDLPPKRHQIIELPVDGLNRALVARMNEETERFKSRDVETIAFNEIAAVRHEVGMAKVARALEFLRDALEGGGKIVVFAYHRDVISGLVEGLVEFGAIAITGDTPPRDRQGIVDLFQLENSGCRVLVGQIQAAGVGLTLTAAHHVCFVEGAWDPSSMAQAEDRCHRIGQAHGVLVQHLVLEGSIDVRMARACVKKQNIIDQTTKG